MQVERGSDKHFERKNERLTSVRNNPIGKGEYYFLILLGFITFVFGFISLAVYFAVLYLAPIVSNLTGLTFLDSRFLLFSIVMLTTSGFFTATYPYSKAIGGNSSFHIILALATSGVSLGVQLYKLAVTGPTWIGIDLLQSHGNTIEMMYLSAVYFSYTLVLFVLQFTIMRKEFSE
ncbi:MAG: hypothetical protein ACP5KD_01670 [Fervidobacterium sp.]